MADAMVAAPDFFHPLTAISSGMCQESGVLVIFIHGIADRNRWGSEILISSWAQVTSIHGKERLFAQAARPRASPW